jgi:kinetochore protein Mis13/DSN1
MMNPPPSLPPLFDPVGQPPSPSTLNPTLLDPEDAAILSSLATSSSKSNAVQIERRLKTVQANIEFQVDQFADGVHKLEQARLTLDGVASKVLGLSAIRLDERERHEKEKVGTRDLPIQEILRTLSRIMPEGSAGGGLT